MNLEEYSKYDALGLAELVKKGEVTKEELASLAQQGLNKVDGDLNAVVEVFSQPYEEDHDKDAPFSGVPTFIKDLGASIAGLKQEQGSRLTEGFVAPITTNFAQNMIDAGFQFMGRSTCPEFGLTLTTESVAKGATKNPWNTEHIAGGSSGGSAALVASGVVPLAHSNDGGGSTRIPASCCGNVGLKVSRGRISLGPIANDISSPIIAEGCNSKTVRDTAAFLDAVSKPAIGEGIINTYKEESFLSIINDSPKKYKIAVSLDDWGPHPMHPEIKSELERVAESLRENGHQVEEFTPEVVTMDYFDAFKTIWFSMANFVVKMTAPVTNREANSDHLESITLQMVEAGEKISAFDQNLVLGMAGQINNQLGQFFEDYDLLLSPTFIQGTPKLESSVTLNSGKSLDEWFEECSKLIPGTPLSNMTGLPAISIPCAVGPGKLPLGMHFFAGMGKERILIDIARQLEESDPWAGRKPEIHITK